MKVNNAGILRIMLEGDVLLLQNTIERDIMPYIDYADHEVNLLISLICSFLENSVKLNTKKFNYLDILQMK
jgi:hypothetical protein